MAVSPASATQLTAAVCAIQPLSLPSISDPAAISAQQLLGSQSSYCQGVPEGH